MAKRQIVYCSLDEQQAIVSRVQASDARFESLEAKARAAVALLQERRTAIISAAVTGKIDVRGWKPPTSEPKAEVA
jgi:type I restriction enzyme S subunit